MASEIAFHVLGLAVRALDAEDIEALQGLCETCDDFFQSTTGLPPGPSEAHSIYIAITEDGDYSRKVLWGVFDDEGKILGVLDLLRDHPDCGSWWIGLLLLHPSIRRQGFGRALLRAIEEYCSSRGAREICAPILSGCKGAEGFWSAIGFVPAERTSARVGGIGNREYIVFRKGVDRQPERPSI